MRKRLPEKGEAPAIGLVRASDSKTPSYQTEGSNTMNITGIPGLMEALQGMQAPFGPRALIVTLADDGAVAHRPVHYGQSVVDIEHDLRSHLTDKPRTDEWLVGLRDFLSDWISAREDAVKFGGIVVPVDEDGRMGARGTN